MKPRKLSCRELFACLLILYPDLGSYSALQRAKKEGKIVLVGGVYAYVSRPSKDVTPFKIKRRKSA
jgi:hypothetical protein